MKATVQNIALALLGLEVAWRVASLAREVWRARVKLREMDARHAELLEQIEREERRYGRKE